MLHGRERFASQSLCVRLRSASAQSAGRVVRHRRRCSSRRSPRGFGSRSLRVVGAPRRRSSRLLRRCEQRPLASNRERFGRAAGANIDHAGRSRRFSRSRQTVGFVRGASILIARRDGDLRCSRPSSAAPRDGRARTCVNLRVSAFHCSAETPSLLLACAYSSDSGRSSRRLWSVFVSPRSLFRASLRCTEITVIRSSQRGVVSSTRGCGYRTDRRPSRAASRSLHRAVIARERPRRSTSALSDVCARCLNSRTHIRSS